MLSFFFGGLSWLDYIGVISSRSTWRGVSQWPESNFNFQIIGRNLYLWSRSFAVFTVICCTPIIFTNFTIYTSSAVWKPRTIVRSLTISSLFQLVTEGVTVKLFKSSKYSLISLLLYWGNKNFPVLIFRFQRSGRSHCCRWFTWTVSDTFCQSSWGPFCFNFYWPVLSGTTLLDLLENFSNSDTSYYCDVKVSS